MIELNWYKVFAITTISITLTKLQEYFKRHLTKLRPYNGEFKMNDIIIHMATGSRGHQFKPATRHWIKLYYLTLNEFISPTISLRENANYVTLTKSY